MTIYTWSTGKEVMKHKMRKFWFIGLICIMAFSGCRKAENPLGPLSADEAGGRTIITIDALGFKGTIAQCVARFNETNPDYYVQKAEYPDMKYEEFMDARALKIMTGRSADIISLDYDFRMKQYIKNNALEDLTPYIERDIAKEDYLDGIFDLYSQNNGVYAVAVDVQANMLLKKCQSNSIYEKLSFADLCDLVERSQHKSLISQEPKGTLWTIFTYFDINMQDKTEVEQAIELAKTYQIDRNDPSDCLFSDCYLSTPDSMASVYISFGKLGRDISAVNQATLTCTSFGISQSSTEKEDAWQFLQFLLNEECQEIISSDFTPVRRENFMAQCDSIYSDENKSQFLTETGVSKEHFMSSCDQMILNGVPREFRVENYDLWIILSEEAEMYYNGDKALSDTVSTIRNRVDLYYAE